MRSDVKLETPTIDVRGHRRKLFVMAVVRLDCRVRSSRATLFCAGEPPRSSTGMRATSARCRRSARQTRTRRRVSSASAMSTALARERPRRPRWRTRRRRRSPPPPPRAPPPASATSNTCPGDTSARTSRASITSRVIEPRSRTTRSRPREIGEPHTPPPAQAVARRRRTARDGPRGSRTARRRGSEVALRHDADVGCLVENVGEHGGGIVDAQREGEARLAGASWSARIGIDVDGAVGADAQEAAVGDTAVGEHVARPRRWRRASSCVAAKSASAERCEPDPGARCARTGMPGRRFERSHLGRERRLADAGVAGGEREAAGGGDAMEGEDVGQVHRQSSMDQYGNCILDQCIGVR